MGGGDDLVAPIGADRFVARGFASHLNRGDCEPASFYDFEFWGSVAAEGREVRTPTGVDTTRGRSSRRAEGAPLARGVADRGKK